MGASREQIVFDSVNKNGIRVVEFMPMGVCAQLIHIEIDANKTIHKVAFMGGCSGNTQGIASLVRGMDANEVIRRLDGIRCGQKQTSCPDQLAQVLKLIVA